MKRVSSVNVLVKGVRKSGLCMWLCPLLVVVVLHRDELPRISRGYCGVTLSTSDCATSSMGSWSENNATRCIQRCLDCARCNFISFSLEIQDCSWYHKCNLPRSKQVMGLGGVAMIISTKRKRERL